MTNEEKMVWAAVFAATLDSFRQDRGDRLDLAYKRAYEAVLAIRNYPASLRDVEDGRREFLGLEPLPKRRLDLGFKP